jgi:hypothetical protein
LLHELRMPIDDLKQKPMTAHLIGTPDSGHSIGHYHRLVFAMVARHFLEREEFIAYLEKDPEIGDAEARSLVEQVESHAFNPPKLEADKLNKLHSAL